jgi:hypothetical protein
MHRITYHLKRIELISSLLEAGPDELMVSLVPMTGSGDDVEQMLMTTCPVPCLEVGRW